MSSQMSFEVTTDLTPVINTDITANFDAVKEWLTEELAPYATMVVTEDGIADARKTRAAINKVGASIDSQRKAVKKEWMRPYEAFESKVKELTGIVNEAVSNIDVQIKEMENAEKEAKRQRLWDLFTESSADIREYVEFEDVFDKKWLNATFAETDAASAIVQQLDDIREGLDAIRSMNSPYESAMLSEYSKSHNLAKAMAEGKRLEAIQKAEEERKAREVVAMKWEPPAPKAAPDSATEPPADDYDGITVESPKPFKWPAAVPKTYHYVFEFPNITREQCLALKNCLAGNLIEYTFKKL